MNDPKPMDPERLAFLRRHHHALAPESRRPLLGELLAAHDHEKARADAAERERDELHARLVESNKALDGLDRRLVERQRERDEALLNGANAAEALQNRAQSAEAEVARLRARVRVEAQDVEWAGVTRAHVEAWLHKNEWEVLTHDEDGWVSFVAPNGKHCDVRMTDGSWNLAKALDRISIPAERPGLDILDEMAAMTTEGEGKR